MTLPSLIMATAAPGHLELLHRFDHEVIKAV
jgi:hypothetical protein